MLLQTLFIIKSLFHFGNKVTAVQKNYGLGNFDTIEKILIFPYILLIKIK